MIVRKPITNCVVRSSVGYTCVSRHSNARGGASCRPVVLQSLDPPTVPQSAICLRVCM